MQSGAFLHLIVTLTAIVARIAHLSSAVRSVLSALHTECAHLFATLDVSSKWPFVFAFASDRIPKQRPLHQHTEAAHNVVSLPPPPQQLDGEDTKVSAPTLGHNRRTVPDTDLDVSVDLGEAVARTPRVTSRPKSTSASPVLPDYLSLEHNATFAPVIGAQRPGECRALGLLLPCVTCAKYIRMPTCSHHCRQCHRRSRTAISPWTFVVVVARAHCVGKEPEPRQAAFKLPHHRKRAEREKASQTEKATTRRD